jgi:hypothetical protein
MNLALTPAECFLGGLISFRHDDLSLAHRFARDPGDLRDGLLGVLTSGKILPEVAASTLMLQRLLLQHWPQLFSELDALEIRQVTLPELVPDDPDLRFVAGHDSLDLDDGEGEVMLLADLIAGMAVEDDRGAVGLRPHDQRIAAALGEEAFFK